MEPSDKKEPTMNTKFATAAQQTQLDAMPLHRGGWCRWGAEQRDGTMRTFYATSAREAAAYATDRLPNSAALVVSNRYGVPLM
jgi:hypothetical protein